eukprot:gnl/TRDRNA2_/TRDRNA2_186516_c0_seq1.p1 gnl/TRDRNA2_/TRDRNA2_186516_c0~~gnl/TRDRNA2_/TRDRNA2_186516_c0_seq1.p1  ORF type:complete len:880 (-),score=151.93 gnl/TRDRNA2_/TRDRNA2_186516_c0_seq1:98-2737(-)
MAVRPFKIPGHRPLVRPEERERPFLQQRRDPRFGPPARCLSRGRRAGASVPPTRQVTDLVATREATHRRLKHTETSHAEATKPLTEIRRELVDLLLHIRVISLEVVEAIERWRQTANRPGAIWPDPATGENYLLKMKADTVWLADSPLGELLDFSPKSDPFFVVPSSREKHLAPTNQMTPMLQANKQPRDPRRAVLPLSSSLLKRIRKAELMILKESVQARIQRGSRPESAALSALAGIGSSTSTAAAQSAVAVSSTAPATAPVPAAAPAPGAAAVLAVPPTAVPSPAAVKAVNSAAPPTAVSPPSQPSSDIDQALLDIQEQARRDAVATAAPPPRPQRPVVPDGAFRLQPLSVTPDDAIALLRGYISRVDTKLIRTFDPKTLAVLEDALADGGPDAPECFWLFRKDRAQGDEAPPDGLVVFRLKRMSTVFGQLLHLSLAGDLDTAAMEEALAAVKDWMFAWLPIKSIRVTLWHMDVGGGLQLDKGLEAVFKKAYFRWFQLTNQQGNRGQVMNRPRAEEVDPVLPVELPCLEVATGQVWLRDAVVGNATQKRAWKVTRNLVVAALCLRNLWGVEAERVAEAADQELADAAREATRAGLVALLLAGDLPKLLAEFKPTGLEAEAKLTGRDGAPVDKSIALALKMARSLEASGNALPNCGCEGSEDGAALVRRLNAAPGFSEAVSRLGTDALPDEIGSLQPRDTAYGRLYVTMDWHSVLELDENIIEVPVSAVGSCSKHSSYIFYAATSEDDTFAVVIPWGSVKIPSEEDVFAVCTEVLRATEPLDPAPYSAMRIPRFMSQSSAQTAGIADAEFMGFPTATNLRVSEFSTLVVNAGREMPGRLKRPTVEGEIFTVQRPFIFGLWHTGVDDLNVPLFATLVR